MKAKLIKIGFGQQPVKVCPLLFRRTLGARITLFGLARLFLIGGTFARACGGLTASFLASIVSYIPASALKVKSVQRHQLFQSPFAVWTLCKRRIRELLQGFGYLMTFIALVLVNGHP